MTINWINLSKWSKKYHVKLIFLNTPSRNTALSNESWRNKEVGMFSIIWISKWAGMAREPAAWIDNYAIWKVTNESWPIVGKLLKSSLSVWRIYLYYLVKFKLCLERWNAQELLVKLEEKFPKLKTATPIQEYTEFGVTLCLLNSIEDVAVDVGFAAAVLQCSVVSMKI